MCSFTSAHTLHQQTELTRSLRSIIADIDSRLMLWLTHHSITKRSLRPRFAMLEMSGRSRSTVLRHLGSVGGRQNCTSLAFYDDHSPERPMIWIISKRHFRLLDCVYQCWISSSSGYPLSRKCPGFSRRVANGCLIFSR
jgi:hypothetical protein